MLATLPLPTHPKVDPTAVPQLIVHSRKPDWGRGALIWARPTKRAYQFEDGRLRKFKEGYYHLLEALDTTSVESDDLIARLQTRGEARQAVLQARREARRAAPPVDADANLGRQIAWFQAKWPDGFQDEDWVAQHRQPLGRALKRHRDPQVRDAQTLLAPQALQTRMDENDALGLRDAWVALLDGTDLAPPAQRRAMGQAAVDLDWVDSLNNLLHGDDAWGVRLECWLTTLRRVAPTACTWPLVTAPLALYDPETWLLARRRLLRSQLQRVRPDVLVPKVPGAAPYEAVLEALESLEERLRDTGLAPTDKLDVYDFMKVTLKPSALEEIDA